MLTFQQELRAYEAALPRMLEEDDGKFVVIQGDKVRKVLLTYEDALNWAYDQFGLARFLVKQIDSQEQVAHFSRDLGR
jgi:hypothetical protein